jgi:hypothetical protein
VIRRVVPSLVLLLAGCTAEPGAPAAPPVPPPTSVFPSVSAQPSPGIKATEEQLRRADPCLLVDWTILTAYGSLERVETPIEFTDCEATVYRPAGTALTVSLGFGLAFGEGADLRPVERDGVTVQVGELGQYGCGRGVAVAERAVVSIHARDDRHPGDLCAIADRVLDAALPKLIAGDVPPSALPDESLSNVDACALLRPEEVFRLRGIDRTRVTPGFDGQNCTWGGPEVSETNVFINFGPALPLEADSTGDRETEIGGLRAVVHPQPGGSNPQYRTPPGCEARIEYRRLDRPGQVSEIEEISIQVTADEDEKYRCDLVTDLAEAAVSRLP